MITNINYTSRCKKDLEKARKQKRDLNTLTLVIQLLSRGEPLPLKFKNQRLLGNYVGRRECHWGPDFLLIYCIGDKELTLERLGTHSQLFR
jgi:mRNA interferase YafQ